MSDKTSTGSNRTGRPHDQSSHDTRSRSVQNTSRTSRRTPHSRTSSPSAFSAQPITQPAETLPLPQSAYRIPVWAPPLIMFALAITGFILTQDSGILPSAFFILFALVTVAIAIFVEPRGLFLSIAPIPVYYIVISGMIGWVSATSPGSGATSKKTRMINAFYPAIEHYLWLLLPFLLAAGIGLVRWWYYKEELARAKARADLARRRQMQSSRTNYTHYRKARADISSSREQRASTLKTSSEVKTLKDTVKTPPLRDPAQQPRTQNKPAQRHSTQPRPLQQRSALNSSKREPLPERRQAPRNYIRDLPSRNS